MAYLKLFQDAACEVPFAAIPSIKVHPTWWQKTPQTRTINGRQYLCFNNGAITCPDFVPTGRNPVFLSTRDRWHSGKWFYTESHIRFTVTETAVIGADCSIGDVYANQQVVTSGGASTQVQQDTYCAWYFLEFERDGVTYYAIPAFRRFPEPYNDFYIMFAAEKSFWEGDFQPPYDYGGADDPDGGHGSGSYGHTGVSDSVAPLGLMPTGGRGLHYYKIDGPAYQSLQGFLWGDTGTLAKSLWAKFTNKTHTPVSCVVGCFALPQIFAPAGSGSSPIQLAGVQLSPISGTCVPFSPVCVDKEYTFSPQAGAYKNFADYTHTTCKLYVPFCGSIPIPMELALNRTIKIRYRVDQANGNLCAAIFAGDCVVGELSGNCAYQIPVSSGDTGALEVLGATVTGLVQISTGDFRGALQSGAEALTAQHTTQLINGDLSGNVSYCSLRKPYIEYTRNATTYTEAYDTVNGIPARVGGTLQSFSGGYGEFDIELASENFPGATEQELEEIANLLRGGVFV